MCGIIGYKSLGVNPAAPVIFDSLKKLEYRGYDSWGIATIAKKSAVSLLTIKRVGKLPTALNKKISGVIGVGHTRWATHGGVTEKNAHPHLSCDGKIAVVHNGIIENYQQLRQELQRKGHKFRSSTDTEVIPHLIEEYKKSFSFETAIAKALGRLKGNYALAIISTDDDRLVVTRNGAPLVLGVGEREFFAASDIPAFLDRTKRVIYLYDNDVAFIGDKIRVYNLRQKKDVNRAIDTIDWTVEQAKKGNYQHYMLKEISEQAETLRRAANQDKRAVEKIAAEIKKARGVFLVGCGTSYHACKTAEYFFSKIAKRHVNVVLASEFATYEDFLKKQSLVIAVSQSGETADVLGAVRVAKRRGARVLSIVNVRGSSLTRYSDEALMMHAGPEICVLSTKTYTSQLALLLLLAYACADKFEFGKRELEKAWNLAFNLTARSTREHIEKLAHMLKDEEQIFTIGRGLHYPTALEAALKIKEVSYIHAEGFAGGELKHGTIALIEEGTPCIVFVGEDVEGETISNAAEIKARGGFIIGVGPQQNEIFDFWIKVPESGNTNPITQIIPIQVLAYQLAVLRGLDPDRPRNLAKSVTVK